MAESDIMLSSFILAYNEVSLSDPVGIVRFPEHKQALKIILPAYYEWIWLFSYDETVFASSNSTAILHDITGEVVSGVTEIQFRTAARIRGDLSKTFFLRGSGRVQIIAQNYESCPFGTGSCGF